jgi:pilus assembly protein Flp/PilA
MSLERSRNCGAVRLSETNLTTKEHLMRRFEFREQEEGQGLVEYALLLMLIAMAVVASLGLVGEGLIEFFNRAVDSFPS